MTTPTKEQVKRILDVVPVEDGEYILPQVIKEWEKMRNEKSTEQTEYYSKLAEELCKRNPGIKDFEDFNKAINSPK